VSAGLWSRVGRLAERIGEKDTLLRRPSDSRRHLVEAILWLCRAQDANADGGVSHSYAIGGSWGRSYPETTGYIIPTMFRASDVLGESEYNRRAMKMADWELTVQLEDGGIPDLLTGRPRIFDTGQVIFGLVEAYVRSGSEHYRVAAEKAGTWLVRAHCSRGSWEEDGREHAYFTRSAWALLRLSEVTRSSQYADLARSCLDRVLTFERAPGWYENNCLNDDARPLLHTIAYTAQGFAESGFLLGCDAYLDAARRTMVALASRVSTDGRIAGRFGNDWLPGSSWSCLTGMAQSVVVWKRLDTALGRAEFGIPVARVMAFMKRTQSIRSTNPGIRGGVKGSYPVDGEYGRYKVLNWATKFFADALMSELMDKETAPLY
jgi:hypothetical protein